MTETEIKSDDLFNQLIAKLEAEIIKDSEAISKAEFDLKLKKARLKKLKADPK